MYLGMIASVSSVLYMQVYYGLRAGMNNVALRAAERAMDYSQRGASGSSVKQLLQQWLGNAAGFRASHGARMVQEYERLLQGYNAKQVRPQIQLPIIPLMKGLGAIGLLFCLDAL
jgi:hypothetical protein